MARIQQKHACTQCRASKVRCLVDTLMQDGKCRRCCNVGTDCVFTNFAPRQRRKRTDTRVSELEQQIEVLKTTIGASRSLSNQLELTPAQHVAHESVAPICQLRRSQRQLRYTQQDYTQTPLPRPSDKHDDNLAPVIDVTTDSIARGDTIPGLLPEALVSVDYGASLLAEFVQNVLPEYPIMLEHDMDDFLTVRSKRPILLLAMITAASRGSNPSLFTQLHSRLITALADKIVLSGQRSLELIQATLIMEIWYCPPDDMRNLNFYLWLQISGTMAQQLGLLPIRQQTDSPSQPSQGQCIGHNDISKHRNSLAAYLPLSCVAVSLRRPMHEYLRTGIASCLGAFTQLAQQVNDKRLGAWVQLQLIAEEIESDRMFLQSQSNSTTSYDASTAHAERMQVLEEQLAVWRRGHQTLMNSALRVHFLYCRCKLYENAMMAFRLRYIAKANQPNAVDTSANSHDNSFASDPSYIKHVMSLIQASHSLIDFILQMDITHYRKCPTVTTVRALYALHELRALHVSLYQKKLSSSLPITKTDICFEFYTSQLDDFFRRAAGSEGFQVPLMALKALEKARITARSFDHLQASENSHNSNPSSTSCNPDTDPSHDTARVSNDLEEILTTPLAEVTTTPSNSQQVQNTWSATALVDSDTSADQPDPHNWSEPNLTFSEFELMTMPEVAMDWSWMFSDLRTP